jgi:hypothetical protein
MELFSLRKIRRICPRHSGSGPLVSAHRSTDFIKRWPLATGTMAQIKPIELVSLLRCLDPIWRWVAMSSSQSMQESPDADPLAEAAGSGRGRHWLMFTVARHDRAWRLTGVRVFWSYASWFSIRFAPMGSQRWGERVYANLNRWRAATKPSNSEAASGEALTPRTCTKASLSSLLASRPTNCSDRRWKTRIWWLPRVQQVLVL